LSRSHPSHLLAGLAIGVGIIAIAMPFAPFASWSGFEPLAGPVLAGLLAITALYVLVSEVTKKLALRPRQSRQARTKSDDLRLDRATTRPTRIAG
jgi:Mg2+-importing ATPase